MGVVEARGNETVGANEEGAVAIGLLCVRVVFDIIFPFIIACPED